MTVSADVQQLFDDTTLEPTLDERAAMLSALVRIATQKGWACWWRQGPRDIRIVCIETPTGRVGFPLPLVIFQDWMPCNLPERDQAAPVGDLMTVACADWVR